MSAVEFRLTAEATDECEWYTFLAGGECNNAGTYALVQQGGREDGFHWAHLCRDHAKPALDEMEKPVRKGELT
jgi:hypothetical protein